MVAQEPIPPPEQPKAPEVPPGRLINREKRVEYRDENDWFINTYRPFWNYNGSIAAAMPQILEAPSSSMSVFNNSMPSFTWDTIDFNKAKALFSAADEAVRYLSPD